MTKFDREWAETVAGHKLTDEEIIQLTAEYNKWLDETYPPGHEEIQHVLLDSIV